MTEPYQPPTQPTGPTPPSVGPNDPTATSDDRLWALLAYAIPVIVPIILLVMEDKKSRPFIRSHVYQALVAGIALWVIVAIIGIIPLVQCISPIVALVGWVYLVYLGIQAYNGNYVTIPFVTDFVKQQGWS